MALRWRNVRQLENNGRNGSYTYTQENRNVANFNQRLVEYNRDIWGEKGCWWLTGCSHVRGPRTLDFLDVFVRLLGEQLVKIGYDLVQQSETLDTLVIRLQFHVKLRKIWYRGEHYANEVALFVI